MRRGVRRWQYEDGTLTPAGRRRYEVKNGGASSSDSSVTKTIRSRDKGSSNPVVRGNSANSRSTIGRTIKGRDQYARAASRLGYTGLSRMTSMDDYQRYMSAYRRHNVGSNSEKSASRNRTKLDNHQVYRQVKSSMPASKVSSSVKSVASSSVSRLSSWARSVFGATNKHPTIKGVQKIRKKDPGAPSQRKGKKLAPKAYKP